MLETSSQVELEKMTDQELIKAFLDLGPRFSELQKMFQEVESKKIITAKKESMEVKDQVGDDQIDNPMPDEEKSSLKMEENEATQESDNKSKYPDYNFGDPTIPTGWCSKLVNNGPKSGYRKIFRSPDGKLFLTRKGALQFMLEEKCFPEADVDLMRSHCVYKTRICNDKIPGPLPASKVSKPELYNTNDPTLPKGWSSKLLSNGSRRAPKKMIRSPQGEVFLSRRKALEYMLENREKYSKYEIEKMKQLSQPSVPIRESPSSAHLKEEDAPGKSLSSDQKKASDEVKVWLSDPMLPPGWLYNSPVKNEAGQKGSKRVMKFRTVEGKEIESSWKALKFMRSNAKYSNCEIESFVSFYRKKKKSDQEEDSLEEARELEIVNGDRSEEKLEKNISPESSARKSGRVVNLGRFSPHPLLPSGWLMARYELTKGGTLIRFKSPAGETIHSRKKVLEMLKSEGYSPAEIENFQKITSVSKKEDEAPRQELQNTEHTEKTVDVETLGKVVISEVKTVDNPEDLEFSLISESSLNTSDDLTLDEEAILNLTEDDFEIVGHTYSEDSSQVSEETDETFSEDAAQENLDCDESLLEENASLGPKISYSPEAFHILSEAFQENTSISEAEISSLSDLICAPQKDVKWFFLKLRHLVRGKNIEDDWEKISELLESLTQSPCDADPITI